MILLVSGIDQNLSIVSFSIHSHRVESKNRNFSTDVGLILKVDTTGNTFELGGKQFLAYLSIILLYQHSLWGSSLRSDQFLRGIGRDRSWTSNLAIGVTSTSLFLQDIGKKIKKHTMLCYRSVVCGNMMI